MQEIDESEVREAWEWDAVIQMLNIQQHNERLNFFLLPSFIPLWKKSDWMTVTVSR